MMVKIRDKYYDPNKEPIMIILTEQDKNNISNMSPDATKYCCFPHDMEEEDVFEFMKK